MKIGNHTIEVLTYNTVILGAGAAGMNAAVRLYEFMQQRGIEQPNQRIAVVTAGVPLGASRMSGSDKQTYYKMGTSADVADSAVEFAKSLTAGGCTHQDLAMIEAIGSLRGFYNLVAAGVPFPHDHQGSYVGYKTDHDPYERATSAGPKTSKFMSECLEKIVRRCGISIHDHQEAVHIIPADSDKQTPIALLTLSKKDSTNDQPAYRLYLITNLILASGGPGGLYHTSVYPLGQVGCHGLAYKAGLAAENITESQFGLASTKFRWNVSGTYMQAIPRIYSTDSDGFSNPHDFLTDYFDSMSDMATAIFLKGYQWPFDPQRIENHQSSLIDLLVFTENQKGRRVFMDFRNNPVGSETMAAFSINDLHPEAKDYLHANDALQQSPIQRLAHMNQPAIDLYAENKIDLYEEPLEIAVCAQHQNGGFAIDPWWRSTVPGIYVIGEMAGSHGVKRPGGSALNAGQVGALRCTEYIAYHHAQTIPPQSDADKLQDQLSTILQTAQQLTTGQLNPHTVLQNIQQRMTQYGGHIRSLPSARMALTDALAQYRQIQQQGFDAPTLPERLLALQTEHLSLTGIAILKAIVSLLEQGSGSRGSHLVLDDNGQAIQPPIPGTHCAPLKYLPENEALRHSITRIIYTPDAPELFTTDIIPPRKAKQNGQAFETLWRNYRQGNFFD